MVFISFFHYLPLSYASSFNQSDIVSFVLFGSFFSSYFLFQGVWVILSAASLIVVIRALLTQVKKNIFFALIMNFDPYYYYYYLKILVYSSFGIWPYAFEDLIDNTSSNYRLFEHFATIPIIILAIFTETKRCRVCKIIV